MRCRFIPWKDDPLFPCDRSAGDPGGQHFYLQADLEQLSTSMVDSDEIEVKAVISLNVLVLQMEKLGIIGKVEEKPLDMQKIRSMPGITVYMVKATDTMWDIAKRFYTTVEEICELNQLENDSLSEGQPLLLIKR